MDNKNQRKSLIKHHVQRKSWTEEYFGDILVTNIDQSSDALLLESCEGDEKQGDSDLCSLRSSSLKSLDAGDNDSNHVNAAQDDLIDYDNKVNSDHLGDFNEL